jgi:tRNA G18 (ribose-2'-O)-methylase SpoU
MKKNGYFGIGCINMKNTLNYGTLFRTAQIFDADFIFLIGKRFKKMSSDTMCSFRHIPLFEYTDFDDFNKHRPYGCKLVAIELHKTAIPIQKFKHPKQACYLLGAEDTGIPENILKNAQEIIQLPGERSLNVSVAGSIVLYDRIVKNEIIDVK